MRCPLQHGHPFSHTDSQWRLNDWEPRVCKSENCYDTIKTGKPHVHQVWKWPWIPRVCSFCGSIHPDDALWLVEEGWTVVRTGKYYKRYLEPPGRELDLWDVGRDIKEGMDPVKALKKMTTWSPLPPVKARIQHFTEEEWGKLNFCTKDV